MDPFGLVALVARAGWLLGKLPAKKVERPAPMQATPPEVLPPRTPEPAKPSAARPSIEVLPEYELVHDLVKKGFPLVYVTGGAGTGKSTFIHWLTEKFDGHALVAAPTGIAAINIGGKTLHALCMLPPAWILRRDIKEYKSSVARAAKLLIIDEISMVNANLLDGVNAFFKKNRGNDAFFGGLPVVMVGDLFQLPPVVNANVRALFAENYETAKFHGAKSLAQCPYYAVELTKAFRQVDQTFVDLLAKVREGNDLEHALGVLNRTCLITDSPPEGSVWLSPRNVEVDRRNATMLAALPGPCVEYHGSLSGKFKDDRLPAPMRIELKIGAQVMFTKNGKSWVNGSIGHVHQTFEDKVHVRLADTGEIVEVVRETWEQFDYKLDHATGQIERFIAGEYVQLPLSLAWSITIHKSQGKTIERVHIDLGAGAFETGQTYVALSRCRSMAKLTLSRPLGISDIRVDPEARSFYAHLRMLIRDLPAEKMRLTMAERH